MKRTELHEMRVPSAFKVPWTSSEGPICFYSYFIRFVPIPVDRQYRKFGLFLRAPLPEEAEALEVDLHLAHGRIVKTSIVPSGTVVFDQDEIVLGEKFQEMWLKIILDRSDFLSDFVPLGRKDSSAESSLATNFYLLLPVTPRDFGDGVSVDWLMVRRCLSSPIFRNAVNYADGIPIHEGSTLELVEGSVILDDILGSLVYVGKDDAFYFIDGTVPRENVACSSKRYTKQLMYPEQPLLKAKRLCSLRNLLHNRSQRSTGLQKVRAQKEHFHEIPPELCSLKIIAFSKDIGSSLSLFPSLMHRLENFLVAIDLKDLLSESFREGSEVTANRVLEALTTEKCLERLSLERLELLGDAFLKYAVGRHNFLSEESLNEGQLTIIRSSTINNTHLHDLAVKKGLQVYIRDEQFNPSHFIALGRPYKVFCNKDTESTIHCEQGGHEMVGGPDHYDVKCSKSHHFLHWKTIADSVEALTGAFLVDSGFKAAIAFLQWVGIQVDFKLSNVFRVYEESKINLSRINDLDIAAIEHLLDYRFHHKGLLLQAFIHPSSKKYSGGCYQRLEFLGDAALDYLITSYLYSAYPKLNPGQLTDLRSIAVNNSSFGHIAVHRSFHLYIIKNNSNLTEAITKFESFIRLPDSEKDLLEEPACPKVLGDIVESCLGAVLLDAGFDLKLVWKIMLSLLEPVLSFSSTQIDPIRELRELCESCNIQKDRVRRNGSHMVKVEASVKGKTFSCSALNPNSNVAARMAAQKALSTLKGLGKHNHKSLADIVSSTQKNDPQLIGFDELPIVFDSTALSQPVNSSVGNSELVSSPKLSARYSELSFNADGSSISFINPYKGPSVPSEYARSHEIESNEASDVDHRKQTPVESCQVEVCAPFDDENAKNYTGVLSKVSAKSHLFDVCKANYWNNPLYICCKEEGPSHLKRFTYKVTIEIEAASKITLECFSEPLLNKKAAKEHAAEGALWYLKHQGFLS